MQFPLSVNPSGSSVGKVAMDGVCVRTFIFFMGTFFTAAMANMLMFLEGSCRSIGDIDAESQRMNSEGIKGLAHLKALGVLLFKRSKLLFFEVAVALLIVQVSFLAVLISFIQAATNLYIAIHGGEYLLPPNPLLSVPARKTAQDAQCRR